MKPVEAAASGASPPIPFKTDAASGSALDGTGWALVLALLCAAAVSLFYAARRRGLVPFSAAAPKALQVTESCRLGEHARLSVVRYNGRDFLVAHGTHGVTLLVDDKPQGEGVRT